MNKVPSQKRKCYNACYGAGHTGFHIRDQHFLQAMQHCKSIYLRRGGDGDLRRLGGGAGEGDRRLLAGGGEGLRLLLL